jgi:hypothetical protein
LTITFVKWSITRKYVGVWVWSLTHVHLYFLHLVFAQWHKFPWSKSIKIYTQIQGLKGRPSSILDFILFFCLYLCPCWYELEEGTWCMTYGHILPYFLVMLHKCRKYRWTWVKRHTQTPSSQIKTLQNFPVIRQYLCKYNVQSNLPIRPPLFWFQKNHFRFVYAKNECDLWGTSPVSFPIFVVSSSCKRVSGRWKKLKWSFGSYLLSSSNERINYSKHPKQFSWEACTSYIFTWITWW